LKISHY
jgi:hypothetical protein